MSLGIVVGGTRYAEPSGAIHHSLDMLDLDAGDAEPSRIPLDFLAHGFAPHPSKKEAALLEKRGPGGAYVDLAERRVIRAIAPMDGHHFYGHGAFSKGADALFAVETDLATNDGAISVRDPERFSVIETFPTYGKAPHDCLLVDGGATLAITNGGGPISDTSKGAMPCVTFVDVASRRLVGRFAVTNPRINTGHLAIDSARSFVVVSAPRDGLPATEVGGVSICSRGGKLRYTREPAEVVKRMVGESLSVAIHAKSRVALATHPYGHMITFWNLDSGELFGMLNLPNARGVTLTLDERYFVVSHGPAASLLLLEAQPLRAVPERAPGTRRFGGSHVYTWAG